VLLRLVLASTPWWRQPFVLAQAKVDKISTKILILTFWEPGHWLGWCRRWYTIPYVRTGNSLVVTPTYVCAICLYSPISNYQRIACNMYRTST